MTTGPENYSNGGANADDRFAAQLSGYRPARRDSGVVLPMGDDGGGDDLGRRNGSAPTIHRVNGSLDMSNPIASSMRAPKLVEPELDDSDRWFDSHSEPLADHPLLRGLLLELPPKASMPPQEWLDRWFEAARSILELLYAQHAGRH
jgi:hypothetical protein